MHCDHITSDISYFITEHITMHYNNSSYIFITMHTNIQYDNRILTLVSVM